MELLRAFYIRGNPNGALLLLNLIGRSTVQSRIMA